jgi:hypothetical protein
MTTAEATTGAATWTDPVWRAGALAWAADRLAEQGVSLDGEPEQPHVRAWSTVFRLPVAGGVRWLKSVGAGSAQEPALVAALGEWVPGHVLAPQAVDRDRRLMLLPDGGTTLRAAGGSSSVAAWEAMLRDYAQLQVELAPRAGELLGLGVPDLRPEQLPGLVGELLGDTEALLLDRPGGLARGVHEQLIAGLGPFDELCRALAESGIPATVQHDDLHDANVFVTDGRHRFFDWGDASVAHPFLSLLVPLRVAAATLARSPGDAVLRRLRDAYLEPWTSVDGPAALRAQADIALRVGPMSRALTWLRILRGVHPIERTEWQDAVPGWTAEYLEPGSLTGPAAGPAARPGN